MARRRAVEWLGDYQASSNTPVGAKNGFDIVNEAELDAAEVTTIVKVLGCITVQVARIFSADPITTQTVAYAIGIGVFDQRLAGSELDPRDMHFPWMWTCSGRGVFGEEPRGGVDPGTTNTHNYAGVVRWHEVNTSAMRKVPQKHGLRLVFAADQVVGTSTGIEATWNLRALCKK